MIIKTIKRIVVGVIVGICVFLVTVGGIQVYKYFNPLEVSQTSPQIVRDKIKEIGVLKLAETTREYKNRFDKGKVFRTELHVMKTFKAFIEYDFENIGIVEVNRETNEVTINVYNSGFKVTEPQLIKDETRTERKIISRYFTDDELKEINKRIEMEIKENFNNDNEFKNKGMDSLKKILTQLSESFGFENVYFNIM